MDVIWPASVCYLFLISTLYLVSSIGELYQSRDILSGHLTAGDASVIFRKEVSPSHHGVFFTASAPRFIVLLTVLALIEIFSWNIFSLS